MNAIGIISPYKHMGMWVFDDARVGLNKEPFVAGIPEIIDFMVKDIPGADKGFNMIFSAQKFPGYTITLIWNREDCGGNWYYCNETTSEGWFCPALYKYFAVAPKILYGKALKKRD